jgi:hypothetical protein
MAGVLTVRIIGDTKPLESAIATSESKLGTFGQKMNDTGQKMAGVGAKLTLGLTAPLALMGKAAVDAGSDLQETLSKSNTVFGDSAAKIELWAAGAARGFGQSKQQALEAAGSFGNMFTQLGIGSATAADMSVQMTELASDFASFHNADITEVLNAQQAAFRGEYDALQAFVPTINAAAVEQQALKMGLATTTGELTAQDKALATQALMMQGAGAAAGDFTRTADGLANSQRIATAEAANASATLGTGLLPITQKVTEWAGNLGSAFGGLSSTWQTTILVGAAVLAAIGPLVGLIGAVTAAVGFLATAFAFLAANPIVLVIGAVVALGAAMVIAYQKSETFRNIVDGAFKAIGTAIEVYTRPARIAIEAISDAVEAAIRAIGRLVNAAKNIPGAGTLGKIGGLVGKIPGFDTGGVVPGPVGSPQLILAHGGETVLPTHKNRGRPSMGRASTAATVNVTVNVQGSVTAERDLAEMVRNAFLDIQRRNPGLGFT